MTGRSEEPTVLEMLAKVVLGVVMIGAGVVMLVTPGPGLLVLAIGVGLVLSQSQWGRRVLARLRLRLRARYGSPRVRQFENRVPKELFPPADTEELRLTALRKRLRDSDGAA